MVASASERLSAATAPTLDKSDIERDNLVFLQKHGGLSMAILGGYRVGAAYEALRRFIVKSGQHSQPDLAARLVHYTDLLMHEMVR